MKNYKIPNNIENFDFENGFYLTCENNRLSSFISHLELYKMILDLPGDILEFGVFKGTSLIQLLSFREYYEHYESRKVFGFDIFGKFPNKLKLKSDKTFAHRHDDIGGFGISEADLDKFLKKKDFKNYELVSGDIIEALPKFLVENPERRFSLIHIDVDVYEPTICILEHTWNKIVSGGIIMLDDFGTVEGETKAVEEFFHDKDVQIKKVPYKYKPSFIIKN